MNIDSASALLNTLLSESDNFDAQPNSRAFISWINRTSTTLHALLGTDHKFTTAFDAIYWDNQYEPRGSAAYILQFMNARFEAQGILEAAIFSIDTLPKAIAAVNDDGIDPELWAFVSTDVISESWGKAITQSCLFLEDTIRKWASRAPEEVGETLMTNVFGDRGPFRLGMTEGEPEPLRSNETRSRS